MAGVTLKAYRREMIKRAVPAVGRVETVAALAAQSVGVNSLAVGGVSSKKFENKWMLRADASTANGADRSRFITTYDPTVATSTLQHLGAAYSDTTVGSPAEIVEILDYEPYLYDNAIDTTIGQIRHIDAFILPSRNQVDTYWLAEPSWIHEIADVERVTFSSNPVLSRNRYFDQWSAPDTTGALTCDWWVAAGTGVTIARSTLNTRRGAFTAAVTRGSANATVTQTIGLLETGVTDTLGDTLRGRTVTIVGVGLSSVASQLRFGASDGTQTVYTSYHTGGGTLEELTTTITIPVTATTLTIFWSIETSTTVVYLEEGYACGVSLSPAIRRDTWPESEQPFESDHASGPLMLHVPIRGMFGQYTVYNKRPYSQFDAARLAGGTADADVSDAPLNIVAVGALANLYRGISKLGGEDTTKWEGIAATWQRRFDTLRAAHMDRKITARGGVDLPQFTGYAVRRV